ncbi:MAG: tetratricopeptide repeat protein, partial [Caldilineales bacterium]|nr:tetratricopeptide repeat protein [Caldilineales bacterium]
EEGEWGLRGPQQRTWLDRLEMEHDNIRAALSWLLAAPDGGVGALRLAGAMQWFWWNRNHHQEGWTWLTQALAHPGAQARTAARANALVAANSMAFNDNELLGKRWLDEAIAIYREVDDKFGLAIALRAQAQNMFLHGKRATVVEQHAEVRRLFEAAGQPWGLGMALEDDGNLAMLAGDYAQAKTSFEQSAALLLSIGDRWQAGASLSHIGMLELLDGNFAAARRLFAERISIIQEIGNRSFLPYWLNVIAIAALEQGDYAAAHSAYVECLALAQEWRNHPSIAQASYGLAMLSLRQGEPEMARRRLRDSLTLLRPSGPPRAVAFCLLGLAELEAAEGRLVSAARLCGAAQALLRSHHSGLWFELRHNYQHELDALLAQFTDAPSLAYLAEGEAMTLEQAIAYALSIAGPASAPQGPALL